MYIISQNKSSKPDQTLKFTNVLLKLTGLFTQYIRWFFFFFSFSANRNPNSSLSPAISKAIRIPTISEQPSFSTSAIYLTSFSPLSPQLLLTLAPPIPLNPSAPASTISEQTVALATVLTNVLTAAYSKH